MVPPSSYALKDLDNKIDEELRTSDIWWEHATADKLYEYITEEMHPWSPGSLPVVEWFMHYLKYHVSWETKLVYFQSKAKESS